MRKAKDTFKKEKNLLKNPLINKAEICRLLDISSGLFSDKLNEKNGARFTDAQRKIILRELKKLTKKLTNGLYPKKKV